MTTLGNFPSDMCAQRIFGSACAFAGLIRIFTGHILDSQGCKCFMRTTKTLIRRRGCAGGFVSSLGAHEIRLRTFWFILVHVFLFCLFYSGFTSLSTIFQSYRDGVWMWQGALCSLLECCLTETSRPRHLT